MPMHPIVSACGTATYNTAKFITKILQNYCGMMSSFIKDSTDFIQKIKHISINPEEETLVYKCRFLILFNYIKVSLISLYQNNILKIHQLLPVHLTWFLQVYGKMFYFARHPLLMVSVEYFSL